MILKIFSAVTAVVCATVVTAMPTASHATQLNLKAQTINFSPIGDEPMVSNKLTLKATASSGLTVTFGSNTTNVCTVSGNMLTWSGAGTCSVTAYQPGNGTYAAAPTVTQIATATAMGGTMTQAYPTGSAAGLNLSGADFSGLDLRGVNFAGALLKRVNFSGAKLRNANFEGAVLTHANFRGAKLKGALFQGAKTKGAKGL